MPGEEQAGGDVSKNESGENQGDRADNGAPAVPDHGKQDAAIDQEGHDGEQRNEPKHRKPLKRFQKISIFIQIVSLSVLLMYTVVSILMWRAMEKSNTAASDARIQDQKQFDQLRSDATSSFDQQRSDTEEQLGMTSDSLAQSKTAAELSQRAWIGIVSIDPPILSQEGMGGFINVVMRNTGHVPATSLTGEQAITVKPGSVEPDVTATLAASRPRQKRSRSVIAPGMDYYLPAKTNLDSIPESRREEALAEWGWHLVGRVTYFNGFRRSTFEYCFKIDREVRDWIPCARGNYAN